MTEPEAKGNPTERTYAVYNKVTGEIVHVHHNMTVPGGHAPSDEDVQAHAILLATKTKNRNPEELATISIHRNDLRRGYRYSVDTIKKELRTVPASG